MVIKSLDRLVISSNGSKPLISSPKSNCNHANVAASICAKSSSTTTRLATSKRITSSVGK